MARIKLTKADVNKAFEEALNPKPQGNIVKNLLQRMRGNRGLSTTT